MSGSTEIMSDIRRELDGAADAVLTRVDDALAALAKARAGDPAALDAVEAALTGVMEACTFADLASQRLAQLQPFLNEDRSTPPEGDRLLHGPEAFGEGLDQAEADRLFAEV